ncbi:MAG TPA: Hsp20/alpha crystallin family protein [Thermodesulfobacteriaceae bacterium]|nr:Hsp20/alpha crystallin family protein [Thermodesulfobacteriaceae bacterium]
MLSPWITFSDPAWKDFDRIKKEIEQLFDLSSPSGNIRGVVRGTFPAVNVGETSENVIVYILAPGMDASKLDLAIEKNLLTVSAERDTTRDISEDATPQGYYRRERFTGRFRRVISLPESVDPGKVEAKYRNGILTVTVGKKEEEKTRKIQVSVG